MKRDELLRIRALIEKGAAVLSDEEALEAPTLFPTWQSDTEYAVGDRRRWAKKLWRCEQAHTSQEDWAPDVTPALWSEVSEGGQGDTPDNPIPYNNNMELFNGKYYSQSGVVYVCFRDTGIPVYNDLSDLVGLYVNVYEGGGQS